MKNTEKNPSTAVSRTPTVDGGSKERGGLPSASGMDRLYRCPGSWEMEKGLSEFPVDETADTGVAVHGALETGDDSELEMTEKEIASKLKEMRESSVAQWMEEFGVTGVLAEFVEQRFWIRNRMTLDQLSSARPDYAAYGKSHGIVLNYKTGFKSPTPSELSWQSRVEVISFWHQNPHLEHIRGGFLASRLSSKIDTTDYEVSDLRRVENELRTILWRSEQPDAPRVPGPHCRYCKARGVCRENAVYSMISAAQVPMVVGKKDPLAVVQAVGRMTPAEMAFVYQRKSISEEIFTAIKFRMLSLSEEQLREVGYKVGPGNAQYPIAEEQIPDVWEKLGSFLTPEERLKCVKISRTPAEKFVAEKEGMTLKDAKEAVIQRLGLEKKEGNPRLKEI